MNISIDNDVFEYIKKNALVYEEKTPNETLRRLFNIPNKKTKPYQSTFGVKMKNPRTNINLLRDVGLINDGQTVSMRDYKGNPIPNTECLIKRGGLFYQDRIYSMSGLAKNKLNENGFKGTSFRGPAFWYTDQGVSIKDLWSKYLTMNYS